MLALAGSMIFCVLFFVFKSSQERNYRDSQIRQVGVYILKDFHGCLDCQVELKEDMTYVISDGVSILESSNWHFEMGGDYFITWLDIDRKQLGSGDYEYIKFVSKIPIEK
jgi:hypothetical protein